MSMFLRESAHIPSRKVLDNYLTASKSGVDECVSVSRASDMNISQYEYHGCMDVLLVGTGLFAG